MLFFDVNSVVDMPTPHMHIANSYLQEEAMELMGNVLLTLDKKRPSFHNSLEEL